MIYKVSVWGTVLFETKSVLGRLLFPSQPRLLEGKNFLNLGCGAYPVPGYVNADFFSFRFWRKNYPVLQWQLDMRYPLKSKSAVFDGIFSEHVLEHIYPDDARRLLSELFRILKPGGVIRITVPDLAKYVRYYTGHLHEDEGLEFSKRFNTGCAAIRSLTQDFFHVALWDFSELRDALSKAGFRDVKERQFREGALPELLLDRPERKWETLYVEARK